MSEIIIKRGGVISRYLVLIVWIMFIFFLSSGNGSSEETSRFIRPLLEFLFPNASAEAIDLYHSMIRKLAHPTVYGILGFLAARAFAYHRQSKRRSAWFIPALTLAAAVAVIDEINQSFLPSRTGSPRDVILDLCGALVALTIFAFMQGRRNARNTPQSE